MVNRCSECQQAKKVLNRSPIHTWEWSCALCTCLHLDFAGPLNGKYFLIVIDTNSKQLEVRFVSVNYLALTEFQMFACQITVYRSY